MKFHLFLKTSVMAATVGAAALLLTTGCAVYRDQETVGAYIDDAAITTRVKARFAEDKTVDATSISVETLKGVVQLQGFAKSYAEKSRAEELARTTKHVVSVINGLVVR